MSTPTSGLISRLSIHLQTNKTVQPLSFHDELGSPLIKRLSQRFFFWLSITIFGACSLLLSTACWTLLWLPEHRRPERLVRKVIYRLMRFWHWYVHWSGMVRLHWKDADAEQLRKLKGAILVANHPNLLDICWVLSHAPGAICLFKAGLKKNSFLSASARMAGYISNDSGAKGIRRAVHAVSEGALLVVFPEGTRTVKAPLNPILPGFALIAKEAHAPIQTLIIESDTQLFTKGRFFTFGRLPMNFHLRLGPCLTPDPRMPARRIAAEVEEILRTELDRSRNDSSRGGQHRQVV